MIIIKFSKKIVITMFVFMALFVIAITIIFCFKGEEPSTLISCVFAFFATEGGCLAMIKTTETKRKKRNESEDNSDDRLDTDY